MENSMVKGHTVGQMEGSMLVLTKRTRSRDMESTHGQVEGAMKGAGSRARCTEKEFTRITRVE